MVYKSVNHDAKILIIFHKYNLTVVFVHEVCQYYMLKKK